MRKETIRYLAIGLGAITIAAGVRAHSGGTSDIPEVRHPAGDTSAVWPRARHAS